MTPSIDPRYPFGSCKTNGRLPVIRDRAEAQRLAAIYQVELDKRRAK